MEKDIYIIATPEVENNKYKKERPTGEFKLDGYLWYLQDPLEKRNRSHRELVCFERYKNIVILNLRTDNNEKYAIVDRIIPMPGEVFIINNKKIRNLHRINLSKNCHQKNLQDYYYISDNSIKLILETPFFRQLSDDEILGWTYGLI